MSGPFEAPAVGAVREPPLPIQLIIFPWDYGPEEIPPNPPLIKGGRGDLRDGLIKQEFFLNFMLSHFDRPRNESRTFRIKPNFDDLVKSTKMSHCERSEAI
jgi:hypothetical protein